MNFDALKAPFPPDKVSWRIGPTSKDKKRGKALAYLDARDVMERLDAVCGPANWQCRYTHAQGTVVCEIGIVTLYDSKTGQMHWVWKADGAGATDVEAEKGSLSAAFKRAAVRWGIGRYLYDVDGPWVDIDEYKQIAQHEYARLRRLLTNGNVAPEPERDPPQEPEGPPVEPPLDYAKVARFKASFLKRVADSTDRATLQNGVKLCKDRLDPIEREYPDVYGELMEAVNKRMKELPDVAPERALAAL